MAYHVYPDPQTAPLTAGAGASSVPITIDKLVGIGSGPYGLDTMFIRVVMLGTGCSASGAADPGLLLSINGNPAVNVTIDTPDVASLRTNPADPATEVANAKAFAESNDVYRIEVYAFADLTPYTMQLQIHNNDAAARDFTWVVASTDPESLKGWINVPLATLDVQALISQPATTHVIQVSNRGTGPLTILPGVLGSGFAFVSAPPPIDPNACGDVTISFTAPASPGQATVLYNVDSDDALGSTTWAGHKKQVQLTATTGKIEITLLLDASGSMGTTPDHGYAVAESDSRWGKAKDAAKQFLDLLKGFAANMGRFSVVIFPNTSSGSANSIVLKAASTITAGDASSAKGLLDGRTPDGLTPMGHGIGNAMGTIAGSFGQFESAAASLAYNRRWILLMTDGDHNWDPPDPSAFYEPPDGTAVAGTSFHDKKIRVAGIPYGNEGSGEVNHSLINTLTAKSYGIFYDIGPTDNFSMDLQKEFRGVLVDGVNLEMAGDPSGVLTHAAPERRYAVQITPYDRKVAFVVNWQTFDAGRVQVQLVTPNCEVISPGAVPAHVLYYPHERYAIYEIDNDYLRNAALPSVPRYGTWHLHVAGIGIGQGEQEGFEYDVLLDSDLKLAIELDHTAYYTGHHIHLTAKLTVMGKPIPNAVVTVVTNAPVNAPANWLAAQPVTKQELNAAAADLKPIYGQASPYHIKATALKKRGDIFKLTVDTGSTSLTYDPVTRGYVLQTGTITTPGNYDFHIVAVGTTEDGVAFRREKRRQVRVEVMPTPDYSRVWIEYERLFDPTIRYRAVVRVYPQDQYGNVYLVNPEADPRVVVTHEGCEPVGGLAVDPVVDGGYLQQIVYGAKDQPRISVRAGDTVLKSAVSLMQPAEHVFIDKVIEFKAGAAVKDVANRFTNVKYITGEIFERKQGEFLALGAGGSVTVSTKGLRAQGLDDVTVFTAPGEEPRAYTVEALAEGGKQWVVIGRSTGGTQSFSLRAGKLRTAQQIRVTDASGKLRDRTFKPTDRPGVCIQGVAFRKAKRGADTLLAVDLEGVGLTYEAALARAGMITIADLAKMEASALPAEIPASVRSQIVRRAVLVMEAISAVAQLRALAKKSVAAVIEMSTEELQKATGLTKARADKVRRQVGSLQLALDASVLRELTIGEMIKQFGADA
jgi:hypothetical protein